jgi:hypothetical protein
LESDRRREDDWFLKNEQQLIDAAREARAKREKARTEQEAAESRARLREQHFMKCPKCGHDMKEEDLDGISVDRCGFCEGIFFDAGELDELFLKRDEERRGFLGRLLKL